jgi:DNA-binding LacI/PurR family transcriptional regulator
MVYERLRGQILSGRWPPQSRIPTENELASEHGVSLITLRHAQRLLVEEGLLIKQQGRGTFVAETARERMKLLWISGVSKDGTDVSAYYLDCLRMCRTEFESRGLQMDPVWLPNEDPNASAPWSKPEPLGRYLGFILVGCTARHPVVRSIKKHRLKHVLLGGPLTPGYRVTRDLVQALELGLEQLGRPGSGSVLLVRLAGSLDETKARKRTAQWRFQELIIPDHPRRSAIEALSYVRMKDWVARNGRPSRVVFLDDVVAQGASRYLLEHPCKAPVRAVVVCGREQVVPLGLPVTYVVHDLAAQVRDAADLLLRVHGEPAADSLHVHEYCVLEESPEELVMRELADTKTPTR